MKPKVFLSGPGLNQWDSFKISVPIRYGDQMQFVIHGVIVYLKSLVFRQDYPYEREVLTTPDGGCVSIDWARGRNDNKSNSSGNPPVIIFLSGITNSSKAAYLIKHVHHFLEKGWICACYVYRGADHTEVKTPILYYGSFYNDLELIVQHVRTEYPKSPICVMGVSLGGL